MSYEPHRDDSRKPQINRAPGDKHPEVIPESLGFIDQESLRMQHLIENLLHLSRADRAEVALQPLDIAQLTQVSSRTTNHLSRNH